jgi:hypothetical protein
MMALMPNKKILTRILKSILILAAYGYVIYKLSRYYASWQSGGLTDTFHWNTGLFLLLLLMMGLNWLLEALRWKWLIRDIRHISLVQSLKAVLSGIAIGLLTPKRIGDVGGRCMMMKPENRYQGLLAFGLGSLLQSGVTLFFGILSVLVILPGEMLIHQQKVTFLLLGVSLGLLLILLIAKLPSIKPLLMKIPGLRKGHRSLDYLERQDISHIIKIFLIGMIRYMVFSTQFVVLLYLFGTPVSAFHAYVAIGLMYFLITFIPVSSLAELGIRGSIAAFTFGFYTSHTEGAILAASGLWIINLALPALAGAWIIGFTKNTIGMPSLAPIFQSLPRKGFAFLSRYSRKSSRN